MVPLMCTTDNYTIMCIYGKGNPPLTTNWGCPRMSPEISVLVVSDPALIMSEVTNLEYNYFTYLALIIQQH